MPGERTTRRRFIQLGTASGLAGLTGCYGEYTGESTRATVTGTRDGATATDSSTPTDTEGTPTANGGGTIDVALRLPETGTEELLRRQYAPVRDHLSEETGLECELTVSESHAAHLDALGSGAADVAAMDPMTAVLGERSDPPRGEIALQRFAYGTWTYASVIVTREDSEVRSLADLEGRSVAFADPLSTSGSLIPLYVLQMAGLDVGDAPRSSEGADFDVRWSGHGPAREALANEQVAAAGVGRFIVWDYAASDYREGFRELAIIDGIPRAPLAVSPYLSDREAASVTEALVDAPEGAYHGEDAEEGTTDDLWYSDVRPVEAKSYDLFVDVATALDVGVDDLDAL